MERGLEFMGCIACSGEGLEKACRQAQSLEDGGGLFVEGLQMPS